jgi:hypothetical protein
MPWIYVPYKFCDAAEREIKSQDKSRNPIVQRITSGRAKLSSFRAILSWQGEHVKVKLCSIHPSAKGELPCNRI